MTPVLVWQPAAYLCFCFVDRSVRLAHIVNSSYQPKGTSIFRYRNSLNLALVQDVKPFSLIPVSHATDPPVDSHFDRPSVPFLSLSFVAPSMDYHLGRIPSPSEHDSTTSRNLSNNPATTNRTPSPDKRSSSRKSDPQIIVKDLYSPSVEHRSLQIDETDWECDDSVSSSLLT